MYLQPVYIYVFSALSPSTSSQLQLKVRIVIFKNAERYTRRYITSPVQPSQGQLDSSLPTQNQKAVAVSGFFSFRTKFETETSRGQQEAASKTNLPAYDPSCYLCPGNQRAQGDFNPQYQNTFIFVNDYSAVKEAQAQYTPPTPQDGSMFSIRMCTSWSAY